MCGRRPEKGSLGLEEVNAEARRDFRRCQLLVCARKRCSFRQQITAHAVPPEFDGKLLGLCRAELGLDLTIQERRHARARFTEAVKARWKGVVIR
jgi:hypothetical protein